MKSTKKKRNHVSLTLLNCTRGFFHKPKKFLYNKRRTLTIHKIDDVSVIFVHSSIPLQVLDLFTYFLFFFIQSNHIFILIYTDSLLFEFKPTSLSCCCRIDWMGLCYSIVIFVWKDFIVVPKTILEYLEQELHVFLLFEICFKYNVFMMILHKSFRNWIEI